MFSLALGFSHLVNTTEAVATFKARYAILEDVHIKYCLKGDIEDKRVPRVIFIPLMAVLEGWVRFLLDLLQLSTLRFYGIWPN